MKEALIGWAVGLTAGWLLGTYQNRIEPKEVTVQDRADTLRKLWSKAEYFTDEELIKIVLLSKYNYSCNLTDEEYVQVFENEWYFWESRRWSDEECKIMMIGGARANKMASDNIFNK